MWRERRSRLDEPRESFFSFKRECGMGGGIDCDATVATLRCGEGEERVVILWDSDVARESLTRCFHLCR